MRKKYIIELEDNESVYKTIIANGYPILQVIVPIPYTEPNMEQVRKEAYDKGYDDATAEIGSDEQAIAEKAYQKGLSDAWDAARTLWNTPNRKEIFGYTVFSNALMSLTGQEVIEKIRQYEQEKEEIKVGDEVEAVSGKAVIIEVLGNGKDVRYMYPDASTGFNDSRNVTRTGRHFPEIAEVLQKMKES